VNAKNFQHKKPPRGTLWQFRAQVKDEFLGRPKCPNGELRNNSKETQNPYSGDQGTCTVNSPGVTNVITPPQMQVKVLVSSKVGMLASSTVGAPGTQGSGVFGTHGMGVRTPNAAAVAAATSGLAGDMHMPNGMMLTKGMLSMMLASGTLSVIT
jgi:hypothetical protein